MTPRAANRGPPFTQEGSKCKSRSTYRTSTSTTRSARRTRGYWASAASWDPATKQGHVVDTLDNGSIHELDAEDLARALIRMVALKPLQVVALAGGVYDGITGDILLQLMAFNELRYG
jgi:hypothetical protein